jgi:hypothetical protein
MDVGLHTRNRLHELPRWTTHHIKNECNKLLQNHHYLTHLSKEIVKL